MMESDDRTETKPKDHLFLCIFPGCNSNRANWVLNQKRMYGSDSSSAVEKHILRKHFLPIAQGLPKKCTVKQAKEEYNMEHAIKQHMLKVDSDKLLPCRIGVPTLPSNSNDGIAQRGAPVASPLGSAPILSTSNDDIESEQIVYNPKSPNSPVVPVVLHPLLIFKNLNQTQDLPPEAVKQMQFDATPPTQEASDKKRRMENPPERVDQEVANLTTNIASLRLNLTIKDSVVCGTAHGAGAASKPNMKDWILEQLKDGPKTADQMRVKWKEEFKDDSIRAKDFNVMCYQDLKGIVVPNADKPPKFKLM